MSKNAKKDAIPKNLMKKFSRDREEFLTDEEDYITFYILHTVDGNYGLFDKDEKVEEDILDFVGDSSYQMYTKQDDNQAEEKYFKKILKPELNAN